MVTVVNNAIVPWKYIVFEQFWTFRNLYNRSTKDSSLDPKYENCEWMKNVDPKMVTLIENEVGCIISLACEFCEAFFEVW